MASPLGDFLAGVGGANVNRPGLEAFVANSQANNALRSAQTEEALLKAQDARDQQDARQRVEGSLGTYLSSINDPHPAEHAKALGDLMASHYGNDFKESEAGLTSALHNNAFQTVTNPNAPPDARMAADQGLNPGANPYQVDQGQLIPRFQAKGQGGPPTVFQTPGSQATQAGQNAGANLHNVQAAAGGFNPHTAGVANLPPEQQAAIEQAMAEGRLHYKDINSRNAAVIGSMALNHPTYNFNEEAADAALSRNANFQQRSKVMDTMPGLMTNLVSLGKKLKYPDLEVAGQVKKFYMGQTNDPDLAAYAASRNDVLLKMAGIMRGVGMSDHATMMEEEALKPTLSGPALDSWLKAQMGVVQPLMDAQKHASHIGAPGTSYEQPHPEAGGPGGATAPATQPQGTDLAALARAELQRRGIKVP